MEITVPDTDAADVLVDLWVALAEEQRTAGSHLLARANTPVIREAIVRHILSDSIFVARGEEIIGFVMFTREQPTFEQDVTRGLIENIYVKPDYRNEGIGSDLLSAAEDRLRDRDVEVVSLEVMAANEAARRLYTQRGYQAHRLELERHWKSDTHSKDDG